MKKPINSLFTPENIEYVSMKDGRIGSIYFKDGRIRLVHPRKPKIDEPDRGSIKRYTVSNKDLEIYEKWKKRKKYSSREKYKFIRNLSSFRKAVIGEGDKLIEVYKEAGKLKIHSSRGRPEKIPYELTQKQINLIYSVADLDKNIILLRKMSSDSELKGLINLLAEK